MPMAIVMVDPPYFKEFFVPPATDQGQARAVAGRLSFAGELIFMLGGLAAAMLYLLTRQTWSHLERWWLSIVAMVLILGHVVAMGYCRGININATHAYLPPMWLLSAIGIAVGVAALLLSRPRRA